MYLKLKKITSIKMDSATLLDGLWPLENEGLGTAVVEEHERERFEWHEPPLVGAEVIDGLPEGVSIEGEDWITIQLGQSSMTNGTWGLQFREAFADPLVSNEDLTPLYESSFFRVDDLFVHSVRVFSYQAFKGLLPAGMANIIEKNR